MAFAFQVPMSGFLFLASAASVPLRFRGFGFLVCVLVAAPSRCVSEVLACVLVVARSRCASCSDFQILAILAVMAISRFAAKNLSGQNKLLRLKYSPLHHIQ